MTIYGEYLDLVKPESEVEIWENTSWSCDHGVERWKNNCGCAANTALSGLQAWRAPLRESLDWLRDHFAYMYDKEMRKFSDDPWKLRDDYIRVIQDRSRKYIERFIKERTADTHGPGKSPVPETGNSTQQHAHVYQLRMVL